MTDVRSKIYFFTFVCTHATVATTMEAFKRGDYVRHNKHDPSKGETDYTYYVVGDAFNTETQILEVVYEPLYDAPYDRFVRAKELWEGEGAQVEKEGIKVPRFEKITDPALLSRLTLIHKEKYGGS